MWIISPPLSSETLKFRYRNRRFFRRKNNFFARETKGRRQSVLEYSPMTERSSGNPRELARVGEIPEK
jgi:hypothetical protein